MRLNDLRARLKSTGHRVTPQRLAIMRILAESREHPSVDQIYGQVRENFPTTSLATVYNTLRCLREIGEVLELPFSGGSRYDGRNPSPHPHVVCTVCGTIEDLDIHVRPAVDEVAASSGYVNVHRHLEFHGVCPRCQGKSAIEIEASKSKSRRR